MKNNLLRRIPFLVDEGGALNFWGDVVGIIITLIVAWILVRLLTHIIQRWGDHAIKWQEPENPGRIHTVTMMGKAVAKVAVWFTALIIILDVFGVNTASLIATAGVGALAIGFGAQSLVKDVISGFFILWEDQFSVGDVIQTAGLTGKVRELGVRTTKLLDFDGSLHIIPNGEIATVTNFSRGPARALVQVPVPYEADLHQVKQVLEDAFVVMARDHSSLQEGPLVHGISKFGDSAVLVQVYATVTPGEQWAVEREIRQVAKESLDAVGIHMPYPQVEIRQIHESA